MLDFIDPSVAEILKEQGIEDLYPPQKEAIPIALEGKDLVLSIPTAGGKSLVAYVAIINKLLKEGGKALYVVPLRALAREKYEDLLQFKKLGIKVGMSTGDLTESSPHLARYDVIVCTSEKADSLLRHNAKWLSKVSILVVDEIHLLHDPGRGPTLEVVIARFRKLNPNIQIIALSATIKNAEDIADWLNAELVSSNWRPVELKEGVFYRGKVEFADGTIKEIKGNSKDAIQALVLDCLSENGQVLVFVNTRNSSVSLAKKLSSTTVTFLREEELKELEKVSKKILSFSSETVPLSCELAECIRKGCAFHHAGLSGEERKTVEDAFKKGLIKCIVATPTLAAGVNVPARRVIIRDLWRYEPGIGMCPIPVLEYKQQAGRAGRPKYDKVGEAIVLARDAERKRRIMREYIFAEPEPIYSKLGTESALRFHLLSIIASGFAQDIENILDFMGSTFYAYQSDVQFLEDNIVEVLNFLEKNDFIERYDDRFKPTLFGTKTSSLYIDPLTALQLRRALENIKDREPSSLSYLHAVCSTPDMRSIYLKGEDEWVEEKLRLVENDLLIPIPSVTDVEYEWFLSDFKTALLLEDWINEVPLAEISNKYGVGPGDIHVLIETAEWLVYAMRELARVYRFASVPELTDLIMRVKYGCKKELLNLVSLKDVGRVRARSLYNAGFKTISSLRGVPIERLAQIPNIGRKVAMSIKRQIGDIK